MLKISNFVEVSEFCKENKELVAIFNSKNGKLSIVSKNFWQEVNTILLNGNSIKKIPQTFVEDFLVDDAIDEFEEILNENKVFVNKTLRYVVMVSGTCNFGCDYCGQNHKNIKLSKENQDRIFEDIKDKLRTKKFEELFLGWFGGEPMLALDVIESLAPRLIKLCEEENVRYVSHIATNASLLTEERAEICVKKCKINFWGITIDGNAEEHNARRCLKGRQGTFNEVYNNFKGLLKIVKDNPEVEVTLRCNVDMRNADAIFHLIDILHADHLERYKNLFVYLAPIHDWGNDAGKKAIEQEEFARLEIQAMAQLIELGFSVKPLPKRKHGCLYTSEHAIMSDPEGNLFPCSEVGLVDAYIEHGLHKYQIGDLEIGVCRARDVFEKFKKITDANSPCRRCKIFPTCAGACPKQWQDGNLPCPTTRYNLKEKMLLAYLLSQK